MLFIMGITNGRKDFSFHQMMVCSRCGQYGNYSMFMTYTVLSLFFIPCFKWNRRYYVVTSCCHSTYALDPEIGKRIAKGENVEIIPEYLTCLSSAGGYGRRKTDYYDMGDEREDTYDRYNRQSDPYDVYNRQDDRQDGYGRQSDLYDRHNRQNDRYDSGTSAQNLHEEGPKDNQDWYISGGSPVKRCANCGFSTQEDYDYCPKCGRKL